MPDIAEDDDPIVYPSAQLSAIPKGFEPAAGDVDAGHRKISLDQGTADRLMKNAMSGVRAPVNPVLDAAREMRDARRQSGMKDAK